MKKSRFLILTALVLLLIFALVGCKGQGDDTSETAPSVVYYTVTFNSAGGSEVESAKVAKGGFASAPTEPTKEGFIFDYWSYDGDEWLFTSDKVTADITLTAVWVDAASVYNYQTVEGTQSCIITGYKRQFETMRIPEKLNGLTVVGIGDGLFEDISTENTSKIIVDKSVVSVGNNAFKGCLGVEIEIKGALTSIGEAAFYECEKLKSVTFGETLEAIPPQAFGGCISLTEIVIPKSVKVIDENAFEDCVAIKSVVLHDTVTSIKDGAFIGCDGLVTVYFYGTEQSFDAIEISSGNTELQDAKLYLYSAEKPATDGNYWYFNDNGKIKIW